MSDPSRSRPPSTTEPVGGGRAWRPSLGYLAAALGIVAGGLALLPVWSTPPPAPAASANPAATGPVVASGPAAAAPLPAAVPAATPAPATPVRVAAAGIGPPAEPVAPAATPRAVPRMREPGADQTPDLSDYVNPGETPTMAEVIDRLHHAGVFSGLGAFLPPGTQPPLIGLAVPEDFALPEGYVRHYQATDDGQRIEPILMYSPDYRFFDAANRPIAIPDDRVVPPELAPAGLPIRAVAIPAPIEPESPRR